jgi:hypothetical protein
MGQECIRCGKPATTNIQKLWVKWKYDAKKDEYSSTPELLDLPTLEGENLHLCDDCAELWCQGEI